MTLYNRRFNTAIEKKLRGCIDFQPLVYYNQREVEIEVMFSCFAKKFLLLEWKKS
nr:MAG TPA: hypothetical protein [Caudoviricetes sp.]